MVAWFNDSRLVSFLLTPLSKLRFFRITQRVRICEHCANIGKDIHWAKDDRIVNGIMKYTHLWLCNYCFYHKKFAHPYTEQCVKHCWPFINKKRGI